MDEGLVGAVGVCNYDVDQLKKFHSLMAARNISVVSNQVSDLPPLAASGNTSNALVMPSLSRHGVLGGDQVIHVKECGHLV